MWLDPKSNDKYRFKKHREETLRRRKKSHEAGGRDCSDAATSLRMQEPPEAGSHKGRFSFRAFKGSEALTTP